MKRDMNLIREILLYVESTDETQLSGCALRIAGHDDQVVGRHVQLLAEAGLLHANVLETDQGPVLAQVSRLSWAGHEFLDAARNEGVWSKTLAFLKHEGVTVPVEVLKTLLISQVKSWLKIPEGKP